jgi:hypothetical protein
MTPQQLEEFVLERNPLMMPRLALDITNHGSALRLAYAECPVTALPGKRAPLWPSLLHPTRGICFHDPKAFCHREVGWQLCEQVNMIGRSADRNRRSMQLPQNPADVSMHTFRIESARNGARPEVEKTTCVSRLVWVCAILTPLRGRGSKPQPLYPRTPGATFQPPAARAHAM